MAKKGFSWKLIILVLYALIAGISNAKEAEQAKGESNDDVSKAIEEKGKSIDALSSLIEHSTDNMEDEIEKAGKAIDSPEAEKRIEIAGKGVDELADEMEDETEKEGEKIEGSIKTADTAESRKEEINDDKTKAAQAGDKHDKVSAKVKEEETKLSGFEKQEIIRQKMEDLVDKQGNEVEEIGNKIEKSKRNKITDKYFISKRKKLRTNRSHEKIESKGEAIKDRYGRKKAQYVNKKATKRRVIVPVNREKLEKLMLYYYVKDKVKNGELNSHNLWKFFDHVKQLPLDAEKPEKEKEEEVGSVLRFSKEEDDEEINKERRRAKEHRNPDLGDFKNLLEHFLKSKEKKEEEEKREKEKVPDLESMMMSLGLKGEVRSHSPLGTADEDETDKEKMRDDMQEKESDGSSGENIGGKGEHLISTDQVHSMLDKIRTINKTIFAVEKKRKEKEKKDSSRNCTEDKCVGRALISMLDDALKAVTQEKSGDSTTDPEKQASSNAFVQEKKVTGATRSKSDPYAGIGFAETEEKSGETEQDRSGTEKHLTSHGVDVIGTSHPVGMLSERAHLRHRYHDDDDDDGDDDDEDDDEGYFHHGHMGHGGYFPIPMPQAMHHMHHHIHHVVHDINDHYDDDHHGYENGHHGYYGGHVGYHGHIMPIRTNHHQDHHGYTEPLNVDTAPMPHYPNRHWHDHLDVDTILRGHPYNFHHHAPPPVALEGPISTAPVYEDMHHMLNGPGIHDQPDVHYEVEMHAHPHEAEQHDDDEEGHESTGDHGDHSDYHHDDEETHGDKKHIIEKVKKKSHWRKNGKKVKSKPSKNDSKKKKHLKMGRLRREDDDDEGDDDDDEGDDDDVEIEKVPRNGHGVARLSYLTQRNGEDMEHQINEGIMDVEDVGRSIEEKVQRGVDRVTEISNHEVEAPDYDHEGHMQPSIHREDIVQRDSEDAYKKSKLILKPK